MAIELELQIASGATTLPHPSQFREWIRIALENKVNDVEMTIRIVDSEEMQELNKQYRNKNKPTNVLSFPGIKTFDGIKLDNNDKDYLKQIKLEDDYLGDIIICAPIMEKEAIDNEKNLSAHWAHIVIHGALHLIGYNHEELNDAEKMEGLETEILVKLGFEPPYGDKIHYE